VTAGAARSKGKAFLPLADALFSVLDADRDEHLSKDEYSRIFMSAGVDGTIVATAFGKLDRNGDGRISRQEWRVAVDEFFASQDPQAPGAWLLGGV
jgi:Ca2+-binding EF-hand superfamily protein